jgi:antitoxin VapB
MALSIKHPEADRLARELAAATGESLTDAIINALKERLRRQRGRVRGRRLRDEIRAIRTRCAALPLLDDRSADEILGYDEHGVPR